MRRRDREVTDLMRIADIISRCTCCRVGFYDNGDIYIVPLNFGYERKNDTYIFYFHGAEVGRKMDLAKKNPTIPKPPLKTCAYPLPPPKTPI